MRHILLITILIAGLLIAPPSSATSLFDEDGCDLFTADTATEIGDLVTIIISETTSASNRASTETQKSLNTDGELSVTGFLQWIAGFPETIAPVEDLTFTPSEDFGGEGRVTTQGTFTTRFTATVIDILPNGNLLIEGTRTIDIAEDTANLVLRGVIQTSDLTVDNTIQSNLVAELEITYNNEGIIGDRQHDGILSRIFNFFF
jgi:flagellar L-ring protein FlgH